MLAKLFRTVKGNRKKVSRNPCTRQESFYCPHMADEKILARKLLRDWRERQTPRISQRECGEMLGKTGALVRMFERGKAPLTDRACVTLSLRTGIPLSSFLTREHIRHIVQAARLLSDEHELA